jgi:hypothetical protein
MSIRAVSRPSRLTRNNQPQEGPGLGRGGRRRRAEEGEREAIIAAHRRGATLAVLMRHFQRSRAFVQKTLAGSKREASAAAGADLANSKKGRKTR